MTESPFPLTTSQFTLVAGTFLVANVAAFWYIRRSFFKKRAPVMDQEKWREFELVERRQVTHNTAIYRFKLPASDDVLQIPIGQHLQLCAKWEEKEVIKSYTPITLDDTQGHFELLIKTYPQGNASRYVDALQLGERARFRGPKGRFVYRPNMAREVGMIAGGTGITPILQVIKAILRNPADRTNVSLIFANVHEDDILLHRELRELAETHPSRLKVHFVLDKASDGWKGGVGYVSADMIRSHCPAPAPDTRIMMCGPPPMMQFLLRILTEDIGFAPQSSPPSSDDQILRF